MGARLPLAILLIAVTSCGGGDSAECDPLRAEACESPDGGVGSSMDLVVSVEWLRDRLDDPGLQPVDTRASGFEDSRIPGAIHLRPSDLTSIVDGISGQIAPSEEAQSVLRSTGLRPDVTVVVYGEPPEYDSARIVWALRYYGHDDVRYLDGGFAAWARAEGAVEQRPPAATPTDYTIDSVVDDLRVSGDWVRSQLGDPPGSESLIQLVDARSEGEFSDGRIPGARSVNWTRNLEGGALRPQPELEALYEGLDPSVTTVTYCTTGLRGSFAWLTLTALGFEDVRLYDGSFAEWANGNFPIER